MKISELNPKTLTDEQISNLLYENISDDQVNGDCIVVLGSSKAIQYRLPIGMQLYNAGRAEKILFSGGVTWPGTDLPESHLLKKKAVEQGMPEEDILIEDISLSTKENILASSLVLDRYFELHNIKRLLIVTTTYHMRRSLLTFKTYMPDWIQFSQCPGDDLHTRKDNWFLTELGRKRAETEARKIIEYIRIGGLMDGEL